VLKLEEQVKAQQALLDALARAKPVPPSPRRPIRQSHQALDDVPISIRRALADAQEPESKRLKYQDAPTAVGQLPALTMFACMSQDPPWFSKEECQSMSALLGIDVVAVHVCSAERKGLPKWRPKLAAANRLVVALDQATEVFLLDQVGPESKPAANMPPAWRGLRIYYQALPHETTRVYYLDTPDGLLAMRMTPHEAWAVSGIYAQWSHFHNAEQVLLLRN
jgi:hypothetical protein